MRNGFRFHARHFDISARRVRHEKYEKETGDGAGTSDVGSGVLFPRFLDNATNLGADNHSETIGNAQASHRGGPRHFARGASNNNL